MFNFTENEAVTIAMSDYAKTIIADMPEEMVGKTPTPATNHLFKIREGSVPIKKEKTYSFHKIVMQLQYVSQQGRTDVRTAVLFLCKQVSVPDENNYKKLTCVIRYLQSTRI